MAKNKKKASEDAMCELHADVSQKLKALINSDACTAQILNVARQFLKDNGIEVDIQTQGEDFLKPEDLPYENGMMLESTTKH